MTATLDPRRRNTACLSRWLRSGNDDACRNTASTPLLTRQSMPLDPAMSLDSRSPNPADVRDPHNCARRTHPHTRFTNPKSP